MPPEETPTIDYPRPSVARRSLRRSLEGVREVSDYTIVLHDDGSASIEWPQNDILLQSEASQPAKYTSQVRGGLVQRIGSAAQRFFENIPLRKIPRAAKMIGTVALAGLLLGGSVQAAEETVPIVPVTATESSIPDFATVTAAADQATTSVTSSAKILSLSEAELQNFKAMCEWFENGGDLETFEKAARYAQHLEEQAPSL